MDKLKDVKKNKINDENEDSSDLIASDADSNGAVAVGKLCSISDVSGHLQQFLM